MGDQDDDEGEGWVEDEDCLHENISWHGSRSECQDCGETVVVPGANY
jgi:hypothetical protein